MSWSIERAKAWQASNGSLVLVLLLAANLADYMTMVRASTLPWLAEQNPISALLLAHGGLAALGVAKLVVLVACCLGWAIARWQGQLSERVVAPAMTVLAVGVGVVATNNALLIAWPQQYHLVIAAIARPW